MPKALYRKYRSKSLDEIIGQKHITDILSRAISQGNISHAYLLTGPRGVGKTSVARILAHAINDLPYDEENTNLDIIEIDAASNNGVDDVRDLREKALIAPVAAKKKVYIIDEVHMLSKPAFNALLKTLEEPPEHVVFILATTNIEKLPATIVSRTQRFSFRPISISDTSAHLRFIADNEQIKIDDEALKLIALHSDGSFRDSISLLDQISGLVDSKGTDTITADLIENILGLAPAELVNQIIESIEAHNLEQLVQLLDKSYYNGTDAHILAGQLISAIRQQIISKPQLLPLIDALIDVEKSSQPQMKLLSVLGQAINTPKTTVKTMALSAPVPEVKASVSKLKKISSKKSSKPSQPTNFEWSKFVEYAKQHYIAVYSVLCKCSHLLNDDNLTIYTGNNFYKKKLDDSKYRPLLSECLEGIGSTGLDIHIIATPLPPKDSQAAAIVAIMGGGEEVSLESA